VQVFELRVAETIESDELYKMCSKLGIALEFDELVGRHIYLIPSGTTSNTMLEPGKRKRVYVVEAGRKLPYNQT